MGRPRLTWPCLSVWLAVLAFATDASRPVPGQQKHTPISVIGKMLSEVSFSDRSRKRSLAQIHSSTGLSAPYTQLLNKLQGKTSDDAEVDPNAAADWVIKSLVQLNAAITIARTEFAKVPPDITSGLNGLQTELWTIVHDFFMDSSDTNPVDSAIVTTIHSAWTNTWTVLPGLYIDLEAALEEGNQTAVWQIGYDFLDVMLELLVDIIPSLEPYITAVTDLMGGVVNATEEVKTDSAKAFTSGYSAVMDFFKFVTNGTFSDLTTEFDTVAADIEDFLTSWKTGVEASPLCYRETTLRHSESPTICSPGFALDAGFCKPDTKHGLGCEADCGTAGGTCSSFCGNGKHCCKKDDPTGGTGACANAIYFDRAFTEGAPQDYYQCVQPVSILMEMHQDQSDSLTGSSDAVKVGQQQKLNAKAQGKTVSKNPSTANTANALAGSQEDNCFLGICGSRRRRSLPPVGWHPPWCDHWGDFNEESDGMCVERCAEGFVEVDTHECAQECGADFPEEGAISLGVTETVSLASFSVCATYSVKASSVNTDLLLGFKTTLIEGLKLISVAEDTEEERLLKLTSFSNTLKNLALNFASPQCTFTSLGFPELEKET